MSTPRKTKIDRARTILSNHVAKNGSLPARATATKLLVKRLDITSNHASTYFNTVRKEMA